MVNVFYTSDLHVGHKLVAAIRGFHDGEAGTSPEDPRAVIADPVRHDHVLAARWDAMVKEEDIVYVLGDVSINGSPYALNWVSERTGRKHLIAGNHDPVHPMHSKYLNALPKWLMVFDSVQPFLRRKIAGQEVLLSHFPYWSWGDGPVEGREPRYEQYRLPDMGVPLLHGHTHGPEVEHDHSYHVGLDAHDMRLVPQSTIMEWLETLRA